MESKYVSKCLNFLSLYAGLLSKGKTSAIMLLLLLLSLLLVPQVGEQRP